jgi:hypothetical protein
VPLPGVPSAGHSLPLPPPPLPGSAALLSFCPCLLGFVGFPWCRHLFKSGASSGRLEGTLLARLEAQAGCAPQGKSQQPHLQGALNCPSLSFHICKWARVGMYEG